MSQIFWWWSEGESNPKDFSGKKSRGPATPAHSSTENYCNMYTFKVQLLSCIVSELKNSLMGVFGFL